MNAGAANEKLDFYAKERQQTESGFVRETDVFLGRRSAAQLRFHKAYDKDGLTAREEYYGETYIFQVRSERQLERALEVDYRGTRYRIQNRRVQRDGTTHYYVIKLDQ